MAVLDGIKVIDVSQVAAVPMCARHLADFGAEVIHVENPATGDSWRRLQAGQGGNAGVPSETNYNWENFNRNKRGITLDLSQEAGREVLCKLVQQADVFVTNLRLPEQEKFRLCYDDLRILNPRLVYGSVTGHGKKGPYRETPAYDTTVYFARAGVTSTMTGPGLSGPMSRPAFGDVVAGLLLAFGVLLALYHRDRTGQGQEVDISLLHTGIYQLSFDISSALATGQDVAQYRMGLPIEDEEKRKRRDQLVSEAQAAIGRLRAFYRENAPNPLATHYETKDGRVLVFNALQSDRYWPAFARLIGRDDLEHDPRFATAEARAENNTELYHTLKDAFLSRTLAEWMPHLTGLPFAPLQNTAEVVRDPQVRANEIFLSVDHPTYGPMEAIASPVNLSETPATIRRPAPEFSQHTEEVLLELGYAWEDIALLKEQGIIA